MRGKNCNKRSVTVVMKTEKILLDMEISLMVDSIEEVEFCSPCNFTHMSQQSGGQGCVDLVKHYKDGRCGTRKHVFENMQEEMVEGCNYVSPEWNVLMEVLGKPHMPTCRGSAKADKLFYMFVEPWCEFSLDKWMEQPQIILGNCNRVCLRKRGVQWMLCLTRALHEMHTSSPTVIHQDITSKNIMIKPALDYKVMFVDFGVGKICKASCVSQSYVGIEEYMAPEVHCYRYIGHTR